MKHISGLGFLKELHYDLGIRLNNDSEPKEVMKWLKKRLRVLEGTCPWIIIDWENENSSMAMPRNKFMEDLDDLDWYRSGWPGEEQMQLNLNIKIEKVDEHDKR